MEHKESERLVRTFCEGYAQLAASQAAAGKLMFKLRPKLHMLWEVPSQNSGSEWVYVLHAGPMKISLESAVEYHEHVWD